MEIPVTNGNRAGWLLLVVAGVVTNDPRGSGETGDLVRVRPYCLSQSVTKPPGGGPIFPLQRGGENV